MRPGRAGDPAYEIRGILRRLVADPFADLGNRNSGGRSPFRQQKPSIITVRGASGTN